MFHLRGTISSSLSPRYTLKTMGDWSVIPTQELLPGANVHCIFLFPVDKLDH